VAEQTETHLSINDDAAPAFHVAAGTGERAGDGIPDDAVGTKFLLGPGAAREARDERGEHARTGERAAPLSRRLPR
jgi:hypothetical protein